MQQNSPEWYEFRLDKIGGSSSTYLTPSSPLKSDIISALEMKGIDFYPSDSRENLAKLLPVDKMVQLMLDKDHKDEFYKLLAHRVSRPITPNDYVDKLDGRPFTMMRRGHILEPEAIEAASKELGVEFVGGDSVWVSDMHPSLYVSPDAHNKDNTVAVEVKCLDTYKHLRAWHEKEYPKQYTKQAIKYFGVNEKLEILYFVLYTDVVPSCPILIFEIKREDVEEEIQVLMTYEASVVGELDKLALELTF